MTAREAAPAGRGADWHGSRIVLGSAVHSTDRAGEDRRKPMTRSALAVAIPEMTRAAAAHIEAGRHAEGFALYERVVEAVPHDAAAAFALGGLALRLQELERAARYLRQAIARDRTIAAYHVQLGYALTALGQLDEAADAVRCALAIDPQLAEAHCNLGCIMVRQNDAAGAVVHLRRAVEIDPRLAIAHQNLGAALFRQGRISDAIGSFRHAIAGDPTLAPAYASLGMCLSFLPDVGYGLIADTARRWSQLLPRPAEHPGHGNSPVPHRRLRIGYVSADFRTHAVTIFLENVFAAHDHSAIEVICYSNTRNEDETTARIKGLVDKWRSIVALDDGAAAALIRADRIDILVDLSGHTEGERLALFALKPAPIQCTWLGYWATTGLPEIDYIIADRFVVPAEHEAHYSEKPFRLPDSYLCFTPPALAVAVNDPPARRNGFVTFGSCNNVLKINTRVIALWSRLLAAVPDSRLVLRAGFLSVEAVREELGRQFAAAGVAPERLDLLSGTDRAALLATYNDIDIALDPFPYGGGTTTAEALWMGVPVVSLRGERFSGRVSESILMAVGLPGLIAADAAEYIAAAAALAADPSRLGDLRAKLRGMVVGSSLCDAERFTKHLEAAYRAMWQSWCASKEQAA
jgi:protein O-GlcNAc transferase